MTRAAVVDASVALKWVLPEEGSEAAANLRDTALHAPQLLLVECGNALWARVRRDLISADEARACFDLLSTAPVTLAPDGRLMPLALELALEIDQTVYDCLYLALAVERDAALVTADRRFCDAVRRHSGLEDRVSLLGVPP